MTTRERFFSKVIVGPEDDCWPWTGGRNADGYGHIKVAGKQVTASRMAWELLRGKIEHGLCVCHRCDNPICVNPEHLFLGTQAENIADMKAKGRSGKKLLKGAKRPKLSKVDVLKILDMAKDGNVTRLEIARMFGITIQTVRRIVNGRSKCYREYSDHV